MTASWCEEGGEDGSAAQAAASYSGDRAGRSPPVVRDGRSGRPERPAKFKIGSFFEPEDRTVELQGIDYVLLRERDLHAVASSRHATSGTGLYL